MGKFIFALLVWRMEGEVFVRKLAMKTSLVLSGLLCFFGAMHKWGDNTKRRDCELVAGRFKDESKVWNSLAFGSADGLHEILYRLEMNAKEPTATFPYVLIQIRRLLGNGCRLAGINFVRETKSAALNAWGLFCFSLKLCFAD